MLKEETTFLNKKRKTSSSDTSPNSGSKRSKTYMNYDQETYHKLCNMIYDTCWECDGMLTEQFNECDNCQKKIHSNCDTVVAKGKYICKTCR
jgi:hypothetical protein